MTLMIPKFRILNYALAMLICLSASLGSRWSFAQDEPWEFSPYRVRVMVLTDDVPELNGKFFGKMADEISILAEQTDKSAWRVKVEEAPQRVRFAIVIGRTFTAETIPTVAATPFVVAILSGTRSNAGDVIRAKLFLHASISYIGDINPDGLS